MRAWALARALRARARPLRAGDADRDAPVFIVRFMCSAACLKLKSIQKQLPNWAPNCSKFIPGWLQNPPQNGSKMCLQTLLERSWEPLGYGSIFRSLIFGSSWPLGALLEPSGPKKTNWKRLLDGPRPPRRPVSACLGVQNGARRGVQKGGKNGTPA